MHRACVNCSNRQGRNIGTRAEIVFRSTYEFCTAASPTEIIRMSLMHGSVLCGMGIDIHAANGVFDEWTCRTGFIVLPVMSLIGGMIGVSRASRPVSRQALLLCHFLLTRSVVASGYFVACEELFPCASSVAFCAVPQQHFASVDFCKAAACSPLL